MLAVTLLLDRGLGLGAPGVPARGRRFVTDRHGPTATNGAISAAMRGNLVAQTTGSRRADLDVLRPVTPRSPTALPTLWICR